MITFATRIVQGTKSPLFYLNIIMLNKETITEIVNNAIMETSIFLVEVKVSATNKVIVLLDTDQGITIDECAKVSRFINDQLDREIEDYELEVSSPGITHPLKLKRQYEKNIGRDLEIKFLDGKKIKGQLIQVNEDNIFLAPTQLAGNKKKLDILAGNTSIMFSEIKEAKILISI